MRVNYHPRSILIFILVLACLLVFVFPSTLHVQAATAYEAESTGNTLGGSAVVKSCSTCSGGAKVGYVGNNSGTLTFNFSVSSAGTYTLTIAFLNGDAGARTGYMSVNGGSGKAISFPTNGSWSTPQTLNQSVTLNSGNNTVKFYNPNAGVYRLTLIN